ncbi:MAG TPA: acylphosphatase [Patescibacteria group bacterium]|nr:acylphosphatase [Patescibacteria group bacterium]
MQQAHIFISGFVHEVGFRQFVKQNARRLGLVGWVQNTKDRKVEIVVQGRMEDVKKLILLCRKGPMLSEVKNVSVAWEESEEALTDFQIK